MFNLCFVARLNKMPFVWDVVLPLIESSLFFGIAVRLCNRKNWDVKSRKSICRINRILWNVFLAILLVEVCLSNNKIFNCQIRKCPVINSTYCFLLTTNK